jgi:uncharacterized membrane protein YbaN (DUF454 family)
VGGLHFALREGMPRAIWITLGALALLLGAFGVVLPVLPTTPFVILAAFFFGKSSPAVESWLLENRTFGPMIADWREHGAIRLKYKIISATAMIALLGFSYVMGVKTGILILQAVCMAGAAAYVWTRPNGPDL